MLGEANGAVGRQRKTRYAQAVDPVLAKTGLFEKSGERAGKEPVRAARGITHIGHGEGSGHHDIIVARAPASHDCFSTTVVASVSAPRLTPTANPSTVNCFPPLTTDSAMGFCPKGSLGSLIDVNQTYALSRIAPRY